MEYMNRQRGIQLPGIVDGVAGPGEKESARRRMDRDHAVEQHGHVRRVRKIPPDLRRQIRQPRSAKSWHQKLMWRLQNDAQFLRSAIQLSFALLCLWIGIEFHLFMQWGLTGGTLVFMERPPGVEGFLPISALISLKYWLATGIVNTIHPAALFIFLAFAFISVSLKKAFCSWLCPIGTLSESLWMLGQRIFGRNLRITRWLDYPLRSLKYLLLLFFVHAILQMDVPALREFIGSPYNRMADVKMYLFFANISETALWVILALVVLSVVVKNFWCRYLCPYGALLGFLSFLSPLKVTRQRASCVDCGLCTKACPSSIKVHEAGRVWSDECTACYKCVDVCPVKNTLDLRTRGGTRPVPGWLFGGLVVGVFVGMTGLAMLLGLWQNSISKDEYHHRFRELNTPAYEHFGVRQK